MKHKRKRKARKTKPGWLRLHKRLTKGMSEKEFKKLTGTTRVQFNKFLKAGLL